MSALDWIGLELGSLRLKVTDGDPLWDRDWKCIVHWGREEDSNTYFVHTTISSLRFICEHSVCLADVIDVHWPFLMQRLKNCVLPLKNTEGKRLRSKE